MKLERQIHHLNVTNFDDGSAKKARKANGPLLPEQIRCIISGPSACGKTQLILNLLTQTNGLKFANIYIYSKTLFQPKYEILTKIMDCLPELGYFRYDKSDEVVPPEKVKRDSVMIFDDQDVLNLKHVYNDHVAPDVSMTQFLDMCNESWKCRYGFFVIDKECTLAEGSIKTIKKKYRDLRLNQEKHSRELHDQLKPLTERLDKISENTSSVTPVVVKKVVRKKMKKEPLVLRKKMKKESPVLQEKKKSPEVSSTSSESSESDYEGVGDGEVRKEMHTPLGKIMEQDIRSKTDHTLWKYMELYKNGDLKGLDKKYGPKHNYVKGVWTMGSKPITFDEGLIHIGSRPYESTPGLYDLIFASEPDESIITEEDKETYKKILEQTNAHRKGYTKMNKLDSNNSFKYTNIIRPLFFKGKGMNARQALFEYYNDPNELVDRLKLIVASAAAGNNAHQNEIHSILEELREEADGDTLIMSSTKTKIVEQLYKAARKNFKRRHVVVKGHGDLYQADLIDLQLYGKYNKGNKYILVVIDTFTKMLYVEPLKDKSAIVVADAMQKIINRAPKFKNLQSDDGKGFFNSKFNALMKQNSINHYSTFTVMKAQMAERVIRTLKTKLWKKFNINGNYVWLNELPSVVKEYNHTVHSKTKMRPIDVKKRDEKRLLGTVFKQNYINKKSAKFQEGDHVRVSKYRHIFSKGYLPLWSTEIFRIRRVQKTTPHTYLLESLNKEPILGSFYGEQLQRTDMIDDYLVEKVIRLIRKKNSEYLVKWLGFDESHNAWIKAKDFSFVVSVMRRKQSKARYGRGVLNTIINNLPFEAHLPLHNWCGPGTKVQKRLARGDRGISVLDEACKKHDLAYFESEEINKRHDADRVLASVARARRVAKDASFGEKSAAWIVEKAMGTKLALGAGHRRRKSGSGMCMSRKAKRRVKKGKGKSALSNFKAAINAAKAVIAKNKIVGLTAMAAKSLQAAKKKMKGVAGKTLSIPRIIPLPKRGGFLPLLIPIFSALAAAGGLAGGLSGIVGAVNKVKTAQKQLSEAQRHNETMESIALRGKGIYRPLTDHELNQYAKKFYIPSFRGVFMRQSLPSRPWMRERAIINLDNKEGEGTHWTAYEINNGFMRYFDSYGNLPPPTELMRYARDVKSISYNRERYQRDRATDCGLWCLKFLLDVL
ncbi:hypothetical protein B566_EDAN017889 [Ephemera danica]|nr:hypothetical protein B566_EDAN017889 [Ephemera danica]